MVFDSRERAYRRYQDRGDRISAASLSSRGWSSALARWRCSTWGSGSGASACNRTDRAAGLDLLVRARVGAGDQEGAETALAELTAIATPAETMIVLYGQGPVEFTYVNSADDPRIAKTARRTGSE